MINSFSWNAWFIPLDTHCSNTINLHLDTRLHRTKNLQGSRQQRFLSYIVLLYARSSILIMYQGLMSISCKRKWTQKMNLNNRKEARVFRVNYQYIFFIHYELQLDEVILTSSWENHPSKQYAKNSKKVKGKENPASNFTAFLRLVRGIRDGFCQACWCFLSRHYDNNTWLCRVCSCSFSCITTAAWDGHKFLTGTG